MTSATANTSYVQVPTPTGLLHPVLLDFFLAFNLAICSEILGIFGIISNIINIIIFTKQGFDDTVNITLVAMAISNIGALVTLQVFNIMVNPWFMKADLSFIATDIASFVSFYPHNYFIRVCGFITAFASLERCLCVVFPFTFKRFITKHVVLGFNISIYFISILNVFPVYYMAYLDWRFVVTLNKTLLGVNFRSNPDSVFGISYFITDLFVPYFTFFVIITCTLITGIKLKGSAKWKKSATRIANIHTRDVSKKETKIVRMLSTVSAIFVVCLIPQSAILTAVGLVRGLSIRGTYFDVALLIYSIAFVMETFNSSINIFIYYNMSTKYKTTFLETIKTVKLKWAYSDQI
ncbi:type-1 angiotensin II receptor B-like [Physella acuta]|uniref:type-1 angiotensin II receptor B-like n=1 Tax=Physella acuta TaxID=109671 RepID=UPI0027DE020F|nr:type-1 angiotensin II receptor B-like [Physella acuta]